MDPRTNTSSESTSWMPMFDVRYYNHQNIQDWISGRNDDGVNAHTNAKYAAGSVGVSPLPSPSPPTPVTYSFDQWIALLSADRYSNIYARRYLGLPNSGPSPNWGFQDSAELPSCYSSTPTSSIPSPLSDDPSPYLTSPDQFFRGSFSPFSISGVGSMDLVIPAQPLQDSIAPSDKPINGSYSTSSGHPLPPLASLPGELVTTNVSSDASQGLQGTTTSDTGACPGKFITDSTFMQTTALGLYYPDTALCLDVPLLSAQAENSAASAPSVPERLPTPAPPSPVKWTFRAVDPSPKALLSKRVRNDIEHPSASNAGDSSPDDADVDSDVAGEALIKCEECGYAQSKRRMGDFRRHLKKHDADHLTRVICCGVPPTHPAVARLRPGHHLVPRWYGDRPFYGGCGRSYSRMDALQRHLKKSRCVGGSTKDHQAWRKLYFSHQKRCPHQ